MNKLLTKILKSVRVQKIFFIGLFLITSSIFSLFAQAYKPVFYEWASNKPDFYVGVSEIIGNSILKVNSLERTVNGKIEKLSDSSGETIETIKGGKGIKLGVRFPSWRASLHRYTFQVEDRKSDLSLIIFDYVHFSGFFVGGGVGRRNIESKFSSSQVEGMTTAINFGFEFRITSQFLVGLGYLYALFNYKTKFNNSCGQNTCIYKVDTTLTTRSTYADISYIF